MERARKTLQQIAAGLMRSAPPAEAPILAWPLVCGKVVAEKTHAISFEEGHLRVAVYDLAWRSQLLNMTSQYLASLNQMVGNKVRKISFVSSEEQRGTHRTR